jgi:hypothetical protein
MLSIKLFRKWVYLFGCFMSSVSWVQEDGGLNNLSPQGSGKEEQTHVKWEVGELIFLTCLIRFLFNGEYLLMSCM